MLHFCVDNCNLFIFAKVFISKIPYVPYSQYGSVVFSTLAFFFREINFINPSKLYNHRLDQTENPVGRSASSRYLVFLRQR